jgi:four helix bundle protein
MLIQKPRIEFYFQIQSSNNIKERSVSKILRFEDIEGWKKARVLTKNIYSITSSGAFARDFGLRDQIRRTSVSTMSNIAEGFERGGNKEFTQFLSNAKGSTGETRSHLYVALDAGFIADKQFSDLYSQAEGTGRLIAGFMRYLQRSNYRGEKFAGR